MIRLLRGYNKALIGLALSPDGSNLYSVGKGHKQIWQWDLGSGDVVGKLKVPLYRGVMALTISPDGLMLVCADQHKAIAEVPVQGMPMLLNTGDNSERTSSSPCLAFDRKGGLLAAPYTAVTKGDYGFQLWRRGELRPFRKVCGHRAEVIDLCFSPSGQLFATVSADSSVSLWDLETNLPLFSLPHLLSPRRVAFGPRGKCLAVANGKGILLWDTPTAKQLTTLSEHSAVVCSLAYSPDGRYLASVGEDGMVILHDAETNELVGKKDIDIGKLGPMVWKANSSGLVVAGEKLIADCNLADLLVIETKRKPRGEPLTLDGYTWGVTALAYSPDGKTLATADPANIRLWDLSAGAGQAKECARRNLGFGGRVTHLSWSPDGKQLAISREHAGEVVDCALRRVEELFASEFSVVLFLPSGRLFRQSVSFTQDILNPEALLSIVDPGSQQILAEVDLILSIDSIRNNIVVAEDQRHIYMNLRDTSILRWATDTGTIVEFLRQQAPANHIVLTSNRATMITSGGHFVHVWNMTDGSKRAEIKHPLRVSGLALIPGERLLTACNDGIVRIWDLSGTTELFAFDLGMGKITSLAASPDGMTFAAGVEKKTRIVLMDIPD